MNRPEEQFNLQTFRENAAPAAHGYRLVAPMQTPSEGHLTPRRSLSGLAMRD